MTQSINDPCKTNPLQTFAEKGAREANLRALALVGVFGMIAGGVTFNPLFTASSMLLTGSSTIALLRPKAQWIALVGVMALSAATYTITEESASKVRVQTQKKALLAPSSHP